MDMAAGSPHADAQTYLVVDDDEHVRHVLAQLLRRTGVTCLEADGGVHALTLLSQHHEIGLVITDVRMPQMDGVELLTRIRKRWPETSVLMVTAVDNVKLAVHCLELGAMDYLTKPFDSAEVRARVLHATEKQQLLVANRVFQEQLSEKVTLQAKRLEHVFLASVESLADALEAKDSYTRGHSDRVSYYASAIARRMGVDADQVRQITLGGHVHDVGKIGVREAVLNKAGKLTAAEYAHVMTHPVLGWRILHSLLDEEPIALSVVRSHHERFDGAGLPDGLCGTAIPLAARIMSVADTLDAMTSSRPYRAHGATFDEAVREVVRCSGTQFDPGVVVGLLAAIQHGGLT
ncbi:MAG: HD domain-containing phosphohydrolase, partial [bacterium]